jgi:hypothetical protein
MVLPARPRSLILPCLDPVRSAVLDGKPDLWISVSMRNESKPLRIFNVTVARFGLSLRPVLVDRIIYATITVMSVLIIYDGWQDLKLIDVLGVIVGPIIAMFLAHVFSALLARQVEVGRSLSGRERLSIVGSESRFLLLCVPPAVIVSVLYAFGVSLNDAIRVTLWVEVASLGLWGYLAARRSGIAGWRVVGFIVGGLVVGLVVLLLQVALQPGKAVSGGVAIG